MPSYYRKKTGPHHIVPPTGGEAVALYTSDAPTIYLADSRSHPGDVHEINLTQPTKPTCSCPNPRPCAHIATAIMLAAAIHNAGAIPPVNAAPEAQQAAQSQAVIVPASAHTTSVAEVRAMLRNRSLMAEFKKQISKDATPDEWVYFLKVCELRALNPIVGQIHGIVRGTGQRRRFTIQTGIDGFRVISERTGLEDGMDGPYWCGPDGIWRDFWYDAEGNPPVAAKVHIWKKGVPRPYIGTALFAEYVQTIEKKDRDGNTMYADGGPILVPAGAWRTRPAGQLGKCAEALGRREAFPQDLSGMHTDDELDHLDNPDADPEDRPLPENAWLDEPAPADAGPGPGGILAHNPAEIYRGADCERCGAAGGRHREDCPLAPANRPNPNPAPSRVDLMYGWHADYVAALAASPFTEKDVAVFMRTAESNLAAKLDEWLNASPPTTVAALMQSMGDWQAAGKPANRPRYIYQPASGPAPAESEPAEVKPAPVTFVDDTPEDPEPAPSTDVEHFDETEWPDPAAADLSQPTPPATDHLLESLRAATARAKDAITPPTEE